jgi:hypothetical protein
VEGFSGRTWVGDLQGGQDGLGQLREQSLDIRRGMRHARHPNRPHHPHAGDSVTQRQYLFFLVPPLPYTFKT